MNIFLAAYPYNRFIRRLPPTSTRRCCNCHDTELKGILLPFSVFKAAPQAVLAQEENSKVEMTKSQLFLPLSSLSFMFCKSISAILKTSFDQV